MNRIILHIDFDSFFASVAQQDNSHLRDKPVGITAHNGRTAIIAASREAKARGVKSPSRTYDAQQICPDIVFWYSDFTRYFEVSKKFLKICDSFSPTVEMFSIDEVFMDVTDTARLFGGVDKMILLIKERIASEIGQYITSSIGISHNKLLAKLSSGLNKPNGVCKITHENIWEIYQRSKLTDICGIGYRIQKRLNAIGIYSLLQLRDIALSALINEFGNVEGNFLKDVGLGVGSDEVISYTKKPTVKSVSRNYCLPRNEYDKRIVLQNIFALSEEIALKLRRLKKKSHTVGLFLRGDKNYGAHKTVTEFLDSGAEIFSICNSLYDTWSLQYVRMISVWTGNLSDSEYVPQFLFGNPQRKNRLQKAIDGLNDKFGSSTVRSGFLINADPLTTVPNGFGSDRWDRTNLATAQE